MAETTITISMGAVTTRTQLMIDRESFTSSRLSTITDRRNTMADTSMSSRSISTTNRLISTQQTTSPETSRISTTIRENPVTTASKYFDFLFSAKKIFFSIFKEPIVMLCHLHQL